MHKWIVYGCQRVAFYSRSVKIYSTSNNSYVPDWYNCGTVMLKRFYNGC